MLSRCGVASSRDLKVLDAKVSGAPSSTSGENTFIPIALCGHTIAHLPQSMQMSGSQIGISWASALFSYRVVPVGKVPSTGRALTCLLYTSDAADDLLCVDLGGRRIIKK